MPVTIQLMLLALMLFCAALLTDFAQVRVVLRHPWILAAALVAVWLGPSLLVLTAGWVVPQLVDEAASAGLLVGLVLVASMPVANSSVGWVQNGGGNLALGLALVVMSISLSPWATPGLLALLGQSLTPEAQAECERLVNHFSGWFFVVWVLLPTATGLACRYLVSPRRVARAAGWAILASAAALLLLNYINSAYALPKAARAPLPLVGVTVVLAVLLGAVGLGLAWLLARVLRLSNETRAALYFGLSMKHTGLALLLADAVLREKPLAILLIVMATLAQHVLAGLVQATGQLDPNVTGPS
jgi:predicted Na+-dependent transporter